MNVESFGAKLAAAFDARGRLCVGIDPHAYLLREWELADSAGGAREFGLRVVEAAAGRAAVVKPQVAFFERHGSAGFAALERVLAEARSAGLLVLADAKRGDVGSTVDAYAEAWLSPGSPLEADAMTISAFQGVGSIAGAHQLAQRAGKGLFVLAATSNPESLAPQTAVITDGEHAGATVSAGIVSEVDTWNAGESGALGSTGVVIGATVSLERFGVATERLRRTPILAPGFGHQGARIDQLPALFGEAARNVLVSASRSLLSAGPGTLAAAIDRENREIDACLV